MKNFIFSAIMVAGFGFLSLTGFSQGTIKGKIVEAGSNEALIGASIVVDGTTIGTVTDFNGDFSLSVQAGEKQIIVSYIGYISQTLTVNVQNGQTTDLGTIEIESDAVGLDEVLVFASVAIQRKTPVAISTIDALTITEKLGTQEFPEVLQTTPGVYATKQGGGYGDGRINLRGFDSPNVAVMINGIPVNDMEWGGIYWSNWAGMADVTRSMQVQRGLGASKVAVPSVGGSINIVTKTTDAKEGGSVYTAIGNNGYKKVAFNVSSGLTDNGWAFTILGSRTSGDGYILGTEFEGYSYFANISKQINDNHILSLTGFGAPQWHNQRSRFDKQKISDWPTYKEGTRFNATYGFGVNGQRKMSAKNYYHKPQISLNHFWTINEKSSLSTSAYYSFGSGGGASARGNERSKLYGSSDYRTIEGYLDYAAIMEENAANLDGSQAIIGSSNNDHKWYGLLSTYTTELSKTLDIYSGIDIRYYIGDHNRTIRDLLGGKFFIDPQRADVEFQSGNESYINEKLSYGDKISRDYLGYVLWNGVFSQIEYNKDKLSAFFSGALSNTTYWREDKMFAAPGEEVSDKINFLGWSAKGGANYNMTNRHNVFTNIGYFSRAPYFSNVFLAKDNSNAMNDGAENEKIFSAELGYGYKSKMFTFNFNAYNTIWKDKSLSGALDSQDPDAGRYNALGVNAIHRGLEFEGNLKVNNKLSIRGMLSIGDWKWDNDVEAYTFNRDGALVNSKGEIVTNPADANTIKLDIGGVHVGDAAQTTASLGLNYKLMQNLKIGVDYRYFARLFADPGDIEDLSGTDTWQVPDAGVVDTNMRYYFKIAGLDATLSANVHNLLNNEYITDAESGSSATWEDAVVFYGFGRTGSVALKIKF